MSSLWTGKKIRKQNLGTLDFDKFRSIEEGGEDLPWMHDWLIKQEKRTLNSRPLVDIKVPHKIVTNFVAAHVVLFNKQYVMIKSSRKLLPWTAFSIQGHLTQAFIQQTSELLIQVAGYSSVASALLLFFLLNMTTWPIKIQSFFLNNYSCRLSKKQIYLAMLTWTLHPKKNFIIS